MPPPTPILCRLLVGLQTQFERFCVNQMLMTPQLLLRRSAPGEKLWIWHNGWTACSVVEPPSQNGDPHRLEVVEKSTSPLRVPGLSESSLPRYTDIYLNLHPYAA